MRKLLLVVLCLGLLAITGTAIGGDYTISDSVGICDDYITELFPGSKIEAACRATDMGDDWFIVWNMACPLILADPTTGPRRTGAACQVNKITGKIVYLAVSARELIK